MHNKNDVVHFREVVVGSMMRPVLCTTKNDVVHFREVAVVGSMMRPASSQQQRCPAFQGSSCMVHDAISTVHNNIVHFRDVVVGSMMRRALCTTTTLCISGT